MLLFAESAQLDKIAGKEEAHDDPEQYSRDKGSESVGLAALCALNWGLRGTRVFQDARYAVLE